MHGSLQYITYTLYDAFGTEYKCKGGYIIIDGGCTNHSICFINPNKHRSKPYYDQNGLNGLNGLNPLEKMCNASLVS